MSPIRIAVLECDSLISWIAIKYGGYCGLYTALLEAGARDLQLAKDELEITRWNVLDKREYPDLENIDAILISGSSAYPCCSMCLAQTRLKCPSEMQSRWLIQGRIEFNAHDNIPWINDLVDFVKKVLSQDRVRVIGVCFGHQIIGRAMGAKVARSDRGWELSVSEVDLTARGKEIFGKDKLVGSLQWKRIPKIHHADA